jgi:RHS repeat-associated protein
VLRARSVFQYGLRTKGRQRVFANGIESWRTPSSWRFAVANVQDAGDGIRQQFTSKERDNETGLDYFVARYYSSTQGRFTSPDEFKGGPEELFGDIDPHDPLFYADTAAPQSLNKYHYCLNNPLRFVDPNGHQERIADTTRQAGQNLVSIWKGELKSLANTAIGASNIGAAAVGDNPTEYYQPANKIEAFGMRHMDRLTLVAAFWGGQGPSNVLVAETKPTIAVSVEVENAAAETSTAVRGTKLGGAVTEPNPAPTGAIVKESGATIQRYTGDHGPAHFHVSGPRGGSTRIGQNGRPLRGDPALSSRQNQVVQDNLKWIRRAAKQVMKEFRYNSQ